MPWRHIPNHRQPFANLGGRERDRLAQAIERGRPTEDIFYDFGFDSYYGPRFHDLDDSFDPRRMPSRRHNFGLVEMERLKSQTIMDFRDKEPLGKAMKNLHKQVGKAEEFFATFNADFESDVQSIEKYAAPEILRDLWKNKVKGKKHTEDGDPADDGTENYEKKFGEQKTTLIRMLNEAVNSRLREPRSPRNEADDEKEHRARRLLDKVSMALNQMSDLLHAVPERQQSCKELLVELGLLRNCLDPETDMNKDLYKGGGCDGEEGRNDDGQAWN